MLLAGSEEVPGPVGMKGEEFVERHGGFRVG